MAEKSPEGPIYPAFAGRALGVSLGMKGGWLIQIPLGIVEIFLSPYLKCLALCLGLSCVQHHVRSNSAGQTVERSRDAATCLRGPWGVWSRYIPWLWELAAGG